MIKRERFFEINEKTLKNYYADAKSYKTLYIYPELNAIVTVRPSRTVKKYLYAEYRVAGSLLKRILVKLYAFTLLNTLGVFAAKRIKLLSNASANTLIYPCNKKYRIFDFDKKTVSVTPKDGFPVGDLINEIEFRKDHTAEFIPKLLSFDTNGYTEAIIDGIPVARCGGKLSELSDEAFRIWSDYIAPSCKTVSVAEYAQKLSFKAQDLLQGLTGRTLDERRILTLCQNLLSEMNGYGGELLIGLSHGDLQPGNIWVESKTAQIYIIDWESYGQRSLDYDKATLYEGLRRTDSLQRFVKIMDLSHCTVLMEDVIFRLQELYNLPENFGAEDFERFLQILEERYV